jgi:hypothetical protein
MSKCTVGDSTCGASWRLLTSCIEKEHHSLGSSLGGVSCLHYPCIEKDHHSLGSSLGGLSCLQYPVDLGSRQLGPLNKVGAPICLKISDCSY